MNRHNELSNDNVTIDANFDKVFIFQFEYIKGKDAYITTTKTNK